MKNPGTAARAKLTTPPQWATTNRSRNRRKPKPLRNVALLVLALTAIGSAYLIHEGESSDELWATDKTRNGKPSLEVRP